MRQLVLVWKRNVIGLGQCDIVRPLSEVTEGEFQLLSSQHGAPKGMTRIVEVGENE